MLPIFRPRTGELPMVDSCDLKELCGKSEPGPLLDPGRLRDGRENDCIALSGRWLDSGRSLRLLAGRDGIPNASVSKKVECDARVLKAGDGDKRDSVSMVLSAKDGPNLFGVLTLKVLSLTGSSSVGLCSELASVAESVLDSLVILGVRSLPGAVVCEIHCEDGRFLKPGNFVDDLYSF